MNILLTGAAGQLGSELLPLLAKQGRVVATDRCIPATSHGNWIELDICDGKKLDALLSDVTPSLIVNTAAYTAVDQAEADNEIAFAVNADLPERLAHWVNRNSSRLIHYSTDYIFNGESDQPYCETDMPDPQNVYGESKLSGEQAIESSGCEYVTLRTSWVYSSHGKNFVLSMLNLANKGLPLKVVDDQVGCPTWARNLARASQSVIHQWLAPGVEDRFGVFHYCDDSTLSWHDFASRLFDLALSSGVLGSRPDLSPIPGFEFPQAAKRPEWSVLNTDRIGKSFKIDPASFEQSLQAVIDEIRTRA